VSLLNLFYTLDIKKKRMNAMPRWWGLNHFKEVTKISFTDGSKFEDLAKVNILLYFNFYVSYMLFS